jgi:hypothetical protein
MNKDECYDALVEQCIKVLSDLQSSPEAVYDAAQDVKSTGNERAVRPLIERLKQARDPFWVREELVTALGSIVKLSDTSSSESRDLLLQILSSQEPKEVRGAAAIALGYLCETRAVKLLLDILKTASGVDLMYAAVAALGNIGDPRAIDPLTRLLTVDKLLIPQTAAQGLEKFGAAAAKALPALEDLARRGNQAERRFALKAITAIEEDLHRQ